LYKVLLNDVKQWEEHKSTSKHFEVFTKISILN